MTTFLRIVRPDGTKASPIPTSSVDRSEKGIEGPQFWVRVPKEIFHSLSHTARAVLIAVEDRRRRHAPKGFDDVANVEVGDVDLASDCSRCVGVIQRGLRELEAAGVLRRVRRHGRRRLVLLYSLRIDRRGHLKDGTSNQHAMSASAQSSGPSDEVHAMSASAQSTAQIRSMQSAQARSPLKDQKGPEKNPRAPGRPAEPRMGAPSGPADPEPDPGAEVDDSPEARAKTIAAIRDQLARAMSAPRARRGQPVAAPPQATDPAAGGPPPRPSPRFASREDQLRAHEEWIARKRAIGPALPPPGAESPPRDEAPDPPPS